MAGLNNRHLVGWEEPVWKRTLKDIGMLLAMIALGFLGNGCASLHPANLSLAASQERAERRAASPAPAAPGTPVYEARECIGAVVSGVCHGSTIEPPALKPRCYGDTLGGVCTGPQF